MCFIVFHRCASWGGVEDLLAPYVILLHSYKFATAVLSAAFACDKHPVSANDVQQKSHIVAVMLHGVVRSKHCRASFAGSSDGVGPAALPRPHIAQI